MARRLEISQSDVSKIERRVDVRLSTPRDDVDALGGRLSILCETRDGAFEIRLPSAAAPRGAAQE